MGGNLPEIFKHYISEIRTMLSLAQAAGHIGKYSFDVIFPSSKPELSQKNPNDEELCQTLQNMLLTMQKIVIELSCGVSVQETHSLESQTEIDTNHSEKSLYNENQYTVASVLQTHVDCQIQGKEGNFSHVTHFDTCQDESNDCLSPQHPTTKETEAANVLMNLSGKTADRITHGRAEVCVHSKEPSAFEGKPVVFTLPSASSSSFGLESGIKRDNLVCDEVPQISEKDLLPLATQVLCQFCSKQCEDLVELHEHVLAMHNVPDSELPLMPCAKRQKTSFEETSEQENSLKTNLSYTEIQKETFICNVNLMKSASTSKLPYNKEELSSKQSNKKLQFEEKVVSEDKQESVSYVVCSDVSVKPGDLLFYSEDKTNLPLQEMTKTTQVIITPRNSVSSQDYLHADFPIKEKNSNAVSVKSEMEGNTQNKYRVQLIDKCSKANTSEHIPIASDACATATTESSQVKVAKTKMTIFVCLKCSVCYTLAQEYKNHHCKRDQPFITTLADGSVTLAESPCASDIDLQHNNCNSWYFPEFIIYQKSCPAKEEIQLLDIVHCTTGRKLQLHTGYQPSYLSEQFILFRCPTCDQDTDSLNYFMEHLTAGPCMFRCPECSLIYKNQDKLQSHRTSMHPNIEDRTCPICHQVFEKRHQRNRHLKTKCSANHTCEICGRVLKNEYNLRVHMQSHKERKHVCPECGEKFYRRSILQRHMMRHSGTRPHACTICSAKFFTKQHCDTHLDRHIGFKRYSCSACSKAYYSKHDRNNHFHKVHNKSSTCQKSSDANQEVVNDTVTD